MKFIRKMGRIIPISESKMSKAVSSAGKDYSEKLGKALTHKGKGKKAVNASADKAHRKMTKVNKIKEKNDQAKETIKKSAKVGAGAFGVLGLGYLLGKKD